MESAFVVPVRPNSEMSEIEGDWIEVSDFPFESQSCPIAAAESFEEIQRENKEDEVSSIDLVGSSILPPLDQSNFSSFNVVNNEITENVSVDALLQQVHIMQQGISYLSSILSENGIVKHSLETVPSECNSSSTLLGDTSILPTATAQQLKQVIESTQNLCSMVVNRWQYPRLSFMDFKIGDIALFMPAFIEHKKIWMAFNSGSPNYFLADDSLSVFLSKGKNKEQRTSIIGRIIFLDKKQAETNNPFCIPAGVEYHLCFAEPLYRDEIFRHDTKGNRPSVETK
jgi:hypothetical protein